MNPLLIKSYRVASAIAAHLIVAAAAGNEVTQATANADLLIGVAGSMGASATGDMVDVVKVGREEVLAGGTVSFGDPLTSDADGKAIKAVPVASTIVRIIGFAEVDAEAGDIFPFHVAPGILTNPAA